MHEEQNRNIVNWISERIPCSHMNNVSYHVAVPGIILIQVVQRGSIYEATVRRKGIGIVDSYRIRKFTCTSIKVHVIEPTSPSRKQNREPSGEKVACSPIS